MRTDEQSSVPADGSRTPREHLETPIAGFGAEDSRYTPFNPAYLLELQHRERVLLDELKRVGVTTLKETRILDVGCGFGTGLLMWVLMGANPAKLYGLDLSRDRLEIARCLHPSFELKEGNATALPWPSNSFDLVSQFTTFSSIVDPIARKRAAAEVARVLRDDGHIVWYDFWINPLNKNVRPIRPPQVRALFPGFHGRFRRVTLAPPVARRVADRSWFLAAVLRELPFLQTHYLAVLSRHSN
jgi:ubiquinone/menaquinone biosynthesis C-methylase UbiE